MKDNQQATYWLKKTSLVLFLSIAVYGCQENNAEAPLDAPTADVTTQKLTLKDIIITDELPGRTKASVIAEVRPQVGGIILSQNFSEGLEVTKGETLYQIDPATYKAALMQAHAGLERAKANQFAAKAKADRVNSLAQTKAVSKQDVDDTNSLLLQANAEVLSGEASVKTAQISLDYTKMLAPISGQIGRSTFTQGALVSPGQTVEMAVIQQLDPMRVDITYSSTEFSQLQRKLKSGLLVGASTSEENKDSEGNVSLILEDGSIYEHKGRVRFADRTVNPTTGSILIQAEFSNPDRILLPGMFVRSLVEQGVEKNAILVPQRAVIRDLKGNATVMIVDAQKEVKIIPVETTHSHGNNWVIGSGLKGDETVIVEGIQEIQGMLRNAPPKILANAVDINEAKKDAPKDAPKEAPKESPKEAQTPKS